MPEHGPTHAEIIRRVDALGVRVDENERLRGSFREDTKEVQQQLISTLALMGEQLENIETVAGRVETRLTVIESKVLAYDILRARIVGAIAAGGVFIAAGWWLFKAKIAAVFGVTAD